MTEGHGKTANYNQTMVPMENQVVTNWPYWSQTYNAFGYMVTDNIYLEESVTYPQETTQGEPSAQIEVIGTSFDESNGTDLNQTAWENGGNGPLGIKFTCPDNGPQRVESMNVGGYSNVPGSWSLSWGYSSTFEGITGFIVVYTKRNHSTWWGCKSNHACWWSVLSLLQDTKW